MNKSNQIDKICLLKIYVTIYGNLYSYVNTTTYYIYIDIRILGFSVSNNKNKV